MLRAPVVVFRLRLGWLFGKRLLLLSHVGRRSGRDRTAVLEVVCHEEDPPVWYVAAAWGDRSDWFRNVKQNPNAAITVGRDRYRVLARVVDIDRAVRVHGEYVREHPWAAWFLGRMLGMDLLGSHPRLLAERIPLVALVAQVPVGVLTDTVAPVLGTRAETQATYDRIAPFYGALEGLWGGAARAAGLSALAAKRNESVLDIGCGPGYALSELADSVGPDGRVIGVDLSSKMCTLARRRLERHGLSGTGAVVQGDAAHLPIADGSCDAGFMSFTLELFDTPEIPTVLSECRRVLRPSGRLAVVALSKRLPAPPMQRAYEWGHQRFPRLLDCRPIHLEASLTDAGFTVTEARELSLWGLPVAVAVGEAPPSTGGR